MTDPLALEAFLAALFAVALGEMGDKTQVIALVLAARYRRPWPIVIGIAIATAIAMGMTTVAGVLIGKTLDPKLLRWILGVAFVAVAVWTLIPERDEDDDEARALRARGARSIVLTSALAFLIAELGDKSQAATLVIAARFQMPWPVLAGSVIGELVAIAPAILLGRTTAAWVPLRWIRLGAALLFLALGLWILVFG